MDVDILKAGNSKQVSYDGTGPDGSTFTFFYMHQKVENGNMPRLGYIDDLSGASLAMYTDANSGKKFLVVLEGAGQKLRLVDVTTNNPKSAKVVTMGMFVSPLAVAPGSGDDFFVMSSQGTLTNIDLQPMIPCGNLWNFTLPALKAWANNPVGLSSSEKEFGLRRASSHKDSPPTPWLLSVQQKTIKVSGKMRIVKLVACGKPKKGKGNSCCVTKRGMGAETAEQTNALEEALKHA